MACMLILSLFFCLLCKGLLWHAACLSGSSARLERSIYYVTPTKQAIGRFLCQTDVQTASMLLVASVKHCIVQLHIKRMTGHWCLCSRTLTVRSGRTTRSCVSGCCNCPDSCQGVHISLHSKHMTDDLCLCSHTLTLRSVKATGRTPGSCTSGCCKEHGMSRYVAMCHLTAALCISLQMVASQLCCADASFFLFSVNILHFCSACMAFCLMTHW